MLSLNVVCIVYSVSVSSSHVYERAPLLVVFLCVHVELHIAYKYVTMCDVCVCIWYVIVSNIKWDEVCGDCFFFLLNLFARLAFWTVAKLKQHFRGF